MYISTLIKHFVHTIIESTFVEISNLKVVKVAYRFLLYGFAIIGAFLLFMFLAMKMQWTNTSGIVDENSRVFQSMHDRYNQDFKMDSVSIQKREFEIVNRISLVNEFFPRNAQIIMNVYAKNKDQIMALKMLDAVDIKLKDNKNYQRKQRILKEEIKTNTRKITGNSVFEWMDIVEWRYFRNAIIKDKKAIDSVAKVTGVEARLIVTCLVGEQIRMFNSRRERFKGLIAPLKSLALETNLSYGVTGIKEHTANRIEDNLTKKGSPYYLGPKYENLLAIDTTIDYKNKWNDTLNIKLSRLVQTQDHYYSYLYTALFLKQIKMQWERAGFPIDNRPEILASLFNLGFHRSIPKKDPKAGGSDFQIRDIKYSFGSIAFEFYYSGELMDYFPFEKKHFDWKP